MISDDYLQSDAAFELHVMVEEDLEEVLMIEESCYPFPWTKGIFRDCLQAGYEARILSSAERGMVGYVLWSWAVGEAHLLNLCISPINQRQGLGRYLLMACLDEICRRDVERVLLEVRASNFVAEALYSTMGFRQLGRRKGYYPAGRQREDALIMGLERDEMLKLQVLSA